jgi:hypothetical protein
MKHN